MLLPADVENALAVIQAFDAGAAKAARKVLDSTTRQGAYAPVAAANARVVAAKAAFAKARRTWDLDALGIASRELEAAHDAARLALSVYRGRGAT